MNNIKKNDLLTLDITDMNNLGAGIAHTEEGITVFITGAVTGDRVSAKVIKVTKTYLVARLEQIITPSQYRELSPACHAPASCGGCCYRNLKYQHELEIKRDYVKSVFRKAGLPDVEIEDTRSIGQITGYRNKAQYPVRQTKNGMKAGFFATKTHDLIPADRCMLQPEIFSEIVAFVLDFAQKNGISAYDEETGRGILRHIYIREGKETGQIMLCLVINADSLSCAKDFSRAVMAAFTEITSVMLNVNKKNTNVILGDKFECIGGRDYIVDRLCGLEFMISAGSFYQVNHDAAELLYGLAAERAGMTGNEILADLYCGAGTIGLSMAEKAKMLVGIEIVPEAVECAKKNAEINGVENAYFFCGDASDTGGLLANAKKTLGDFTPDVVVIDPPRKGTTPELMDYLSDIGINKIVYISCGPDTLARDCAYFKKLGYEIGVVTPVDLFPGTGHVESVVCLTRK
ncbi:MAG: 23S rRNA (uracil(1939)-C(5))-methyltransferase RlmD [Ruminococcaceae bacterium]|nr:23S rRNA (uracil(1939)-C(5))-methyltransferase RlmD [Oscillospiraceae bacterium]